MHNLDDLIQDIYKDEALHIPGNLSSKQKKTISDKVLKSTLVVYKKRTKKRMILVLAAVLLLLLGCTTYATEKYEWDIVLTNFMGWNDPSTLQLESGIVEIDKAASCNGLEITKITSIGDKNSAFIRLDTNYELPEDFNPEADYIIVDNFSYRVSEKENGVPKANGGSMLCFYENGKLGFLIEISNCLALNKSYINIHLQDLYLYKNGLFEDVHEKRELLLEGEWDLEWKYSYKSSTKTYRCLKKTEILDNTVWITKLDISPISIRVEGHRLPTDYDKAWGGSCCVQELHFKDGTVIKNLEEYISGRSNLSFNFYANFGGLDQIVDPTQLDYIIIGNEKIDF